MTTCLLDIAKSGCCPGYIECTTRSTTSEGLCEAILAISRDLLNEGGPSSFSMREVARRTGYTHQAPYRHFQGREGILVALVEEGYRSLGRVLCEVKERSDGVSPQDVTRAIRHAYLSCALADPGVSRIVFRLDMYDADARPGLRQASLAAHSRLRSLAHTAYGTDDPHAEVTPWAYIRGFATLVFDGSPALGSGQDAQRFACQAIESPFFIDGVTGV